MGVELEKIVAWCVVEFMPQSRKFCGIESRANSKVDCALEKTPKCVIFFPITVPHLCTNIDAKARSQMSVMQKLL
jgi:hypothetical protein